MRKKNNFWKIGFFVLAVAVVVLCILLYNQSTDTSISKTGDVKNTLTEISKDDENTLKPPSPQFCLSYDSLGVCNCYLTWSDGEPIFLTFTELCVRPGMGNEGCVYHGNLGETQGNLFDVCDGYNLFN